MARLEETINNILDEDSTIYYNAIDVLVSIQETKEKTQSTSIYLSLTLEKQSNITMHLYMTSTTFIFFSGFYGLEKIHYIIHLNSLSSCSTITETSMIKFTTTSNTSYYLRCLEKEDFVLLRKILIHHTNVFNSNYYYKKTLTQAFLFF